MANIKTLDAPDGIYRDTGREKYYDSQEIVWFDAFINEQKIQSVYTGFVTKKSLFDEGGIRHWAKLQSVIRIT